MMNVIAYARVSTDAQAKEDRYGIEAQKQQIRDYASSHDMKIIQWIYDEGESGARERPGFDHIVYGEVFNPPFEAVLVAKSDRVARDINVYYYYKMLLTKKNIQLISIAEDFGQMGMFAPMLEAFTICAAQMERENINKRTSAGRNVKAAKGGYAGGQPPTGYTAMSGKLVVKESEAEVVRFIFSHKRAGSNMLQTMYALNEAGLKTRNGTPFKISTVQSIWKNEKFYQGYYKYGKSEDWVKGEHEPLLSEEGVPL